MPHISRAFPEMDFGQAAPCAISGAFFANGCVLLRNFIQESRLRELKGRLGPIYDETGSIQLFPPDFRRRLGKDIHELLFGGRQYDLLAHLFGPHRYEVYEGTLSRQIRGSAGGPGWIAPLAPHL